MPDPTSSSDSLAVLLLAVVQGLAEFLPVSSSGHLVLSHELFHVDSSLALDVALHVGTLGAVIYAYRRDVGRLLRDVLRGRLHLFLWLVVATIPAGLAGVLLKDVIEEAFGSTRVAAYGFFGTTVLLLLGESFRRRHESSHPEESALGDEQPLEPRFADAIFIGTAQVLAILPGVSRSGTTIAAGLVRGLSGPQAARLSFLMALPAISGAAVLQVPDVLENGFAGLSTGLVAIACVLSGVVGWAALRGVLLAVRRGSFPWFALYTAVLGVLTLVLIP